ncbi:MAG: hypothetical protein U0984_14385, partial [Prosthecobacter sp.]|nr:hypothetical protein [Prosthecobacter sp.]
MATAESCSRGNLCLSRKMALIEACMLWRSISAAIVLFWAVMTGLIIRDAYFPDSSRFAGVPPRMVFDLFLSQAGTFNNQLHLYHEKQKIGHAHFAINLLKEEPGPPVYALIAHGSITASGNE